MPTNKKTKPKPSKSRAPVTKTARSTAKTKAAKPAATGAKPARVKAPAVAPAPKVKASSVPPRATVIARIDVGFGNALYVRGEGAGLSWDKGLVMNCVNDDEWQISLGQTDTPVALKFLINDLTWSAGPDFTVVPGVSITVTPEF
ncbi:MAG: hypothetical protein RIQ93_981 [Verrucomicrobiota bacterium]|jgi:hypothetical protein